jgi:hypothetical protein
LPAGRPFEVLARRVTLAAAAAAAAAAVACALAPLGFAPPAFAVDNGTLGIHPSDESNFFHLSSYPGGEIQATAVVSNHTDAPVTLLSYPVDAISSSAGFAMADMAAPRAGVGNWVHLDADQITVPANGDLAVPFRLDVPANATPGDYAGALIIQSAPVRGATASVDNGTAVRMDVIQRQGVRIYLKVEGTATVALQHGALFSEKNGDAITFNLPVTNTGNTMLHPTAKLRVTSWQGGTSTLTFSAPESLLPGATLTLHARVRDGAIVTVGDADATITSEAGVDHAGSRYAYARWDLIAILLAGASVLILAAWRTLRFVRRARAALTQVNASSWPGSPIPATAPVPARRARSRQRRATRGRHAQVAQAGDGTT